MAKVKMSELIALQNAIIYLDGTAQAPTGGPIKIDRANLKPAPRMFFKYVLGILAPVMKAYSDELKERVETMTGGKPTFTPEQQLRADKISEELRAVEIDIRLPKKKRPSEDLNLDENQIPSGILQGLDLVVEFPKEELEGGPDSDFREAFKAAGNATNTASKRKSDKTTA